MLLRRIFSGLLCLLLCCTASTSAAANSRPAVVILMIADGLGYSQVAASGMYRFGEAGTQCYEQWPVKLAMSTYPLDGSYDPQQMWNDPLWQRRGAVDSAAAATAMACAVKTDNGVIGRLAAGSSVGNVMEAAAAQGLRTGVVTTVPFCHATPAAFGAHVQSRSEYNEIARQMLWESPLDLIIGCGHPWYDNAGGRRSAPDYRYIAEQDWLALQQGIAGEAMHNGGKQPWTFIDELQDFRGLAEQGSAERIFGLPRVWGTLQSERPARAERPFQSALNDNLPDLATLSLAALNTLATSGDGLFLMIEGGAVDWAAHDRDEVRIIEEMQDFNYAVDCVSAWIENGLGWDECLLIVTGDHECGHLCREGSELLDFMPGNNGAGVLPEMECSYGSHTNQLIPLYARGCGAELLGMYADGVDPVRGHYIDNAELGRQLIESVDAALNSEAATWIY